MKKSIIRLPFAAALMLTLTLSALQVFAQTPPAGSPVALHGQLSVVDGKIVNKNGEPVQLRGMSLYWSSGPADAHNYYNADVVKYLASDWNASLIRAAMGIDNNWGSNQRGYLAGDNSGGVSNKKRVTDVVDGAIAAGIYVIIDWHSHNAETQMNEAVAFFQEMANAYKDYPNVIYEIYNEPLQPPQVTWASIKPYMQTVTNAIRAIDQNNIIIIGTTSWCQDVHVAVNDPVAGNNLVYVAHFYAGDTDTQGNPTSVHTSLLRSRIYEAMMLKKQAIIISEFGSVNAQGQGTHNAAETDKWMAFMDDHKISWANWSLSAINEPASALRSSASTSPGVGGAVWSDADLTESGLYVRGKLRSPPNTNSNMFRYLNVTIVPEGGGDVMPKYGSAPLVPDAPFIFEKDTSIYLRAAAASGFRFVRWEGDVEPLTTLLSSELRMDSDRHVTAIFESTDPNVTTTYDVILSGTGRSSIGTGKYAANARVIISSGVPPEGKKFVRWETTSPGVTLRDVRKGKTEFTMPGNAVTITAVFEDYAPASP